MASFIERRCWRLLQALAPIQVWNRRSSLNSARFTEDKNRALYFLRHWRTVFSIWSLLRDIQRPKSFEWREVGRNNR